MRLKLLIKILITVALVVLFIEVAFIIVNNTNDKYGNLGESDRLILSEINSYCYEDSTNEVWPDLDFEKKTLLAVNGVFRSSYLINPQNEVKSPFVHKIKMPRSFSVDVYRISNAFPGLLKYRAGGKFNTIDKSYDVFGNNVYFLRFDDEMTSSNECNSMHFITLLSHESFHYYMQEKWPSYGRFDTEVLSVKDLNLMNEQYLVLTEIQQELKKKLKDEKKLLKISEKYVSAVEKRIENNPDYMKRELSEETSEGTATYVSLKASEAAGYKYENMLFKNSDNELVEMPFDVIVPAIKSGKINKSTIASHWIYESGSLLCVLMDELGVPEWKERLNLQTKDSPVYLYTLLKQHVVEKQL